jgi:hypothetical protein
MSLFFANNIAKQTIILFVLLKFHVLILFNCWGTSGTPHMLKPDETTSQYLPSIVHLIDIDVKVWLYCIKENQHFNYNPFYILVTILAL